MTTIEGLGSPERLHALQAAFIKHDGFQCGYCTPGQICSAIGMASEAMRGVPSVVARDLSAERIVLDHDELRERMSGNLCRWGAHNGIINAIRQVFAEEGVHSEQETLAEEVIPTEKVAVGRMAVAEEDV